MIRSEDKVLPKYSYLMILACKEYVRNRDFHLLVVHHYKFQLKSLPLFDDFLTEYFINQDLRSPFVNSARNREGWASTYIFSIILTSRSAYFPRASRLQQDLKKIENLSFEKLYKFSTKKQIISCRWHLPCKFNMKKINSQKLLHIFLMTIPRLA